MSKTSGTWKNRLLNAGLVLGSLLVAVLLYALVASTIVPSQDPQVKPPLPAYDGTLIQVEVVNGCGVARVAERTRNFLIDRHFDVISVGNHEHFDVPRTLVIDRAGNKLAARQVAAALGVPDERVRQEIRRDFYLDVSVILGKDFATLAPFTNGRASSPSFF